MHEIRDTFFTYEGNCIIKLVNIGIYTDVYCIAYSMFIFYCILLYIVNCTCICKKCTWIMLHVSFFFKYM